MVYKLYEEDYQYFPSLQEIRDGLMKGQMKVIQNEASCWQDPSKLDQLLDVYMFEWNFLFESARLGDLNKPLTPKILANPKHHITKHLLYIYSMQTYVYENLNRACREKDTNQIQFFGPYAAALSYIIYGANKNSVEKLKGKTVLYRGLSLTQSEINRIHVG